MHWVSAAHAVDAEIRQYEHLFAAENPGGDRHGDFLADLNPDFFVDIDRLQTGTGTSGCSRRRNSTIRTPRLLLRRSRRHATRFSIVRSASAINGRERRTGRPAPPRKRDSTAMTDAKIGPLDRALELIYRSMT